MVCSLPSSAEHRAMTAVHSPWALQPSAVGALTSPGFQEHPKESQLGQVPDSH